MHRDDRLHLSADVDRGIVGVHRVPIVEEHGAVAVAASGQRPQREADLVPDCEGHAAALVLRTPDQDIDQPQSPSRQASGARVSPGSGLGSEHGLPTRALLPEP